MSDTPSELTALALNSGSSSLKFGLYRVGASRTDALLTGFAESIGEPSGKFQVQDSQRNTLAHDTTPIRSQRDAVIRIGRAQRCAGDQQGTRSGYEGQRIDSFHSVFFLCFIFGFL